MKSNRRPQTAKSRGIKTTPYKPERKIKSVGAPRKPKYRGVWDD